MTNTRRIVAVVLDGRYLDRQTLDGLLARAEAAAGSSATGADAPDPAGGSGGRPERTPVEKER